MSSIVRNQFKQMDESSVVYQMLQAGSLKSMGSQIVTDGAT
jgi:hypothetical protein